MKPKYYEIHVNNKSDPRYTALNNLDECGTTYKVKFPDGSIQPVRSYKVTYRKQTA